ncbi:MAG: hypothetical protein H7099_04190, partial [Gemmatimonadaceae bacterium]|nr:hypothetical protein [Gemmatimonadaceae bacterium]
PAPVVAPPVAAVVETPKPARPESTTVRVYRGTQMSQQQFPTDSTKRKP